MDTEPEAEVQKEYEPPCMLCRRCIHFKGGLHEAICRDYVGKGLQKFYHKDGTR